MRTYKEVMSRMNEIDYVVCNMCGEKIEKNMFGYMQDYMSVEKQWGYGSPHDGETHAIDICQECYEKMLHMMKIPPSDKFPQNP